MCLGNTYHQNAVLQLPGVDNEESSEARGDLDSGLMEKSSAAAFIGALELTLSSFSCLLVLYRQLEHLLVGGLSEGESW